MENAKKKGIWAGIAALVLFIVVAVVLYLLGGDDQSALERLRDIAVIFIVLMSLVIVVLLAAITAALAVLIIQIKDRVIPLLEEAKGGMNQVTSTATRIKNTTDFVTEEAVRPLMNLTGQLSRLRTMRNTVTGKNTNVKKLAKQEHVTDRS
jgi:predicted PurR-regulated permease PerM